MLLFRGGEQAKHDEKEDARGSRRVGREASKASHAVLSFLPFSSLFCPPRSRFSVLFLIAEDASQCAVCAVMMGRRREGEGEARGEVFGFGFRFLFFFKRSERATSDEEQRTKKKKTLNLIKLTLFIPSPSQKQNSLLSTPTMATSTRTGGTAAGTLAKKVASDIRAAIAEGHAPAGGGGGGQQQQQRKRGTAANANANAAALSFDDPDHKLSAVRQAARELTEGMHEDERMARQTLTSRASGDAVEGTGLARALAGALAFARGHAEEALKGIKNNAGSGGVGASSKGKKGAAAAATTLRLAVSALVAAASACNEAARWGSKGGADASGAAADTIYGSAGEDLWLSVTEE